MQKEFYEHSLYPLQDRVLEIVNECNTPFYLTGGTALSRYYLHHRYSDDLDFFVNHEENFTSYVSLIIKRLKTNFEVNLSITDTDFARLFIVSKDVELKIEFINDVFYHFGALNTFNGHRIDNPLNMLANKITALSRNAAKDYADILYLSFHYPFNWIDIFNAAKEKDTWVNEVSAAEILNVFDVDKLSEVNWIEPMDTTVFDSKYSTIARDILMGADNSLYPTVL